MATLKELEKQIQETELLAITIRTERPTKLLPNYPYKRRINSKYTIGELITKRILKLIPDAVVTVKHPSCAGTVPKYIRIQELFSNEYE